jgi:hypothetical protein
VTRIYCPTGCGSTSFRATRRGVIVQDFTVDDDGTVDAEPALAEAGGYLHLVCTECGHHWQSNRDLDLARFIEAVYR